MNKTIAALSTAPGIAAIGIVRLSGPEAIAVADRIFRTRSGRSLCDAETRRVCLGTSLARDGESIDESVAIVFKAPNSYTGENMVELQCHGSPVILSEILLTALENGACAAGPGEFTKRAFLNGRLDLTQAEAVIDVIEAETVLAAKNATAQLSGSIGRVVEHSYGDLLDISAHFHAAVDYPDEDIEEFRTGEYAFKLRRLEETLGQLHESFARGRVLKNGYLTAILGRPNVGKSSLLNALLGYDRAIVTSKPGTTRDTIEERVVLGGTLLRVVDTAGLRSTEDEAEAEGVSRAYRAADESELVLAVFDGSEALTQEDSAVIEAAGRAGRAIAVINKSDLPQKLDETTLGDGFCAVVHVSALDSKGLDALSDAVLGTLPQIQATGLSEILTSARQADGVSRAAEYVKEASLALARGVTPDAALVEIEGALEALSEVTGRSVREDTIDRIFSRFCVGK